MTKQDRDRIFAGFCGMAHNSIEALQRLPRKQSWGWLLPRLQGVAAADLDAIWSEVISLPWASPSLMNSDEESAYHANLRKNGME